MIRFVMYKGGGSEAGGPDVQRDMSGDRKELRSKISHVSRCSSQGEFEK